MADSYTLRVVDVIDETADARSVVLEVPEEARAAFAYKPGQFLTVAVPSDRTGAVARCYSLSSTPDETELLKFTVKRTVEGYGSNWINDHVRPGHRLTVLPPSGIFTPASWDADLLLFAGGSGITPVISIAKAALVRGSGTVVLLYANRDERSVIFAEELAELARKHPDRLVVVHWLESVQGLPSSEHMRAFAAHFRSFDAFVCGPGPFMQGVVDALKQLGFPRERRHQEKFVSLGGNPFGDEVEDLSGDGDDVPAPRRDPATVTGELDGQRFAFDDWAPGQRLLDFLLAKGLDAPYSCREGSCSACACRVLDGEVRMAANEVLDEDDLADGIRLACQSLPLSDRVTIAYE